MKTILLAATTLAMLSGAAYAQTSTSGSDSTAINSSGSQSSSVSNPKVNVIGNPIGNGASSSVSGATSTANTRSSSQATASPTLNSRNSMSTNSNTSQTSNPTNNATTNVYVADPSGSGDGSSTGSSGTSNQNLNYSGSYTVRNTPEVIAPNVVGGNPCAVGASGGLALPGFGVSAGTTWADKACELRQKVALLFNMGEQSLAREIMCQDDERIRAAMQRLGKPCGVDIPPVAQAAAPAVTHAPPPASSVQTALASTASPPAPVTPVVAAMPASIAASLPAAPRPEWCGRASPATEASRAYFRQVCG